MCSSKNNYTWLTVADFCQRYGLSYLTSEPILTITGLDPAAEYQFRARGYKNGSWSSYSSIVVKLPNKPVNWEWETYFYSGKEFTVYNDGSENYYCIIPAAEWNNFLDKINEFRAYKNLSTVSFPTYATDNYFTAKVYNQAVNAINAMSSYFTGYSAIPTKSSGSELKADDLYRLRDTLNSID